MSLQIAILKVLSSYAAGRASLAAIKADLAILCSSGQEWSQMLKQLSSRAPELDIFGQGLVLRDATGWQLTEAGSALLRRIEAPRAHPPRLDVPARPYDSAPEVAGAVIRAAGSRSAIGATTALRASD